MDKGTIASLAVIAVLVIGGYWFSTISHPDCSLKLDSFSQREIQEQGFYTQKAVDGGYPASMALTLDRSSFVIGYSKEKKSCIGGYALSETYPEVSSLGDKFPTPHMQYIIRNVDTNEIITSYSYLGEKISNPDLAESDGSSPEGLVLLANESARNKWRTSLYELTDGQISEK